MNIKKSWLVDYNGAKIIIIKTKEGYYMQEGLNPSNYSSFVKLEKISAKDFIKRTKLKTCFNCGVKNCQCKDDY